MNKIISRETASIEISLIVDMEHRAASPDFIRGYYTLPLQGRIPLQLYNITTFNFITLLLQTP